MILTAAIVVLIVLSIAAAAAALSYRLGITFRQALLYLPLKVAYRISDSRIRAARQAEGPVIYAVTHESRLDPALMLALLPDDTLHILDESSAAAGWLEPYRDLARTIAFNATHVFVSRRLVRQLKRKGRLAVYFPVTVEPDGRSFRLFRAVARIAVAAGADVVPFHIAGSRNLPWSLEPAEVAPRRTFPKLAISALEPITLDAKQTGRPATTATNTLFDRVAEARIAAKRPRTLFGAFAHAARLHRSAAVAVEDTIGGPVNHRMLMIGARVLAGRFAAVSAGGEAVGLMLPNSTAMATAFVGLQSAGCTVAMINHSAGPANVAAAMGVAGIRTVVSSRAFIDKAQIGDIVEAIERTGARMLWLDTVREDVTTLQKAAAALFWRWPMTRRKSGDAAVILFTSGSEGAPKAVLLSHANILANVAQIESRIAFSPRDTLFNVLPAFHSFGLTGGTILPLLSGVRLFLYPSPLHFKQIPEVAAKARPTIMFGTDTFLAAYARTAEDDDFASLRMVIAGAEPLRAETRRQWRERFGAEILEGYGLTEAAPVVAVNTRTQSRDGTVGRLLPGIRTRLEPVDGIEDGGRLWIAGPNVMKGYIDASRPGGVSAPVDGWHDTGDIVSFDRDGYLTIRGRARRFAKIAGEMVSLGAVEALAAGLWPDAIHSAVSVPDPKRGERVVLVTTQAGADRQALRKHGKAAGSAEIAVPDEIIAVDAIPTLGSGKIDHGATRAMALGRIGQKVA